MFSLGKLMWDCSGVWGLVFQVEWCQQQLAALCMAANGMGISVPGNRAQSRQRHRHLLVWLGRSSC